MRETLTGILLASATLVGCGNSGEPECQPGTLTCVTTGKADGANQRTFLSFPTSFASTRVEPYAPAELDPIAGVPVEGVVYEYQDLHTYFDASLHHTVEGLFGKLTLAQYEALKTELGGRTEVPYSADRDYVFSDFLPPALQALLGQDIEVDDSKPIEGSDEIGDGIVEPKWVGNTSNCHGTAWIAQRAYDGQNSLLEIFYGDPYETELITDSGQPNARFTTLATLNKAQLLPQRDRLKALKPGDVVLIYEIADFRRASMLIHSATYVGGELFFDKPNTEGGNVEYPEETPYRLATLEKLIDMADSVAMDYTVVIVRRKAPLPAGAVAFESALEPEFVALAGRQGLMLGYDLITKQEFGTGGGIRSTGADAVTVFPLELDARGRGRIRQ